MASKENPLKSNVFNQSGNNASNNQNVTPAPTNQMVRRSSRLFGSTQSSVKENSKAPTATTRKSRVQNSPSRKPKTRLALSNQADLCEKNEKNKEKPIGGKDMVIGGTDDVIKKPVLVNVNLGAQALVIQKESINGLMQLLRLLGNAYVEFSKYNCKKASQILESLPYHHLETGWVYGLLGRIRFEQGQYKEAKSYFKEMKLREPYRLDFMEFYSTVLWHLQEEVELSTLAQDVTKIDKKSPQAWCVAGNCFSHLKEHESAIKFFKRAGQVCN